MTEKQERPLVVCAAIIMNDESGEERLLAAKRKADAKLEAGKWEFPGGKLELGEKPEDCLVREIKEELDLEIEVEGLFDVVSHVYTDAVRTSHIILLCYLCRAKSTDFKLLDVADAKWITIDETSDYEWAAADLPPLAKLRERADHRAMNAR